MSTPNFTIMCVNDYYALKDTLTNEDTNEEVLMDYWDWEQRMESIRENIKDKNGFTPVAPSTYDSDNDAHVLGFKDEWHDLDKSGNFYINLTKTLLIRDGHYRGAVLDYDIEMSYDGEGGTLCGGVFSGGDPEEDLKDNVLDAIEEDIKYWNGVRGWNMGLFKMQKNNLNKKLQKIITAARAEMETICKENADMKLYCTAVFSNGEALYQIAR